MKQVQNMIGLHSKVRLQTDGASALTPTPLPPGEGTYARDVAEYLRGERRKFDLNIYPKGTPFQMAVWKALRTIPYGETRTYGEVAKMIRRPQAVRAVARAIAANPLAIVIPCHRVVPASGKDRIGGYAWGRGMKKKLLALEAGSKKRF